MLVGGNCLVAGTSLVGAVDGVGEVSAVRALNFLTVAVLAVRTDLIGPSSPGQYDGSVLVVTVIVTIRLMRTEVGLPHTGLSLESRFSARRGTPPRHHP